MRLLGCLFGGGRNSSDLGRRKTFWFGGDAEVLKKSRRVEGLPRFASC